MAAGNAGGSGHNSGSSPALESTLDRRFQTLTNTMESIQGLSLWCIENKKYHGVIVRYWMKWMRKSEASHKINLFYLANDVIQNCKRKNAIVYRTTFTDVLLEAIKLVGAMKDSKMIKSVGRILSIWEERSVYSEEFISQLKSGLLQTEPPPKVSAPVNSKAALKSKIVAEFVPSAFIEHLSKYRKSMDEIELKEKQLAAMRVDVCSTEALKKLKDKAGGKRFSRDFEDGSAKLQEFISFLDGEVKKGNPLMEALENADIFYEMQYKEVKIVAKAYETFANRVSHLKRKLDALKAMLPDPNDSPIPSPIEDAPSPTGSESPFHSLGKIGTPDPELDGQAMEEDLMALGDAPSPLSSVGGSPKPSEPLGDKDNRDVEDMDLSDVEETETPAIIVEESVVPAVSKPSSVTQKDTESLQAKEGTPKKQTTAPAVTVPSSAQSLPVNLAGVDLGKISSILSTITNVMKNSAVGVSPVSRSSPSVSSTPTSTLKTPTSPSANPLASFLSRVDINPNTLLGALSKTQTQGLSSLLNNQAVKTTAISTSNPEMPSLTPPLTAQSQASPRVIPTSSGVPLAKDPIPQGCVVPKSSQSDILNEKVNPSSALNSNLDSKIDNFLQGKPCIKGFNLGFPCILPWPKGTVDSPLASAENLGGTPVRDEAGATPTQDEIMDVPRSEPLLYQQGQTASTATTLDAKSTLSLPSRPEQNFHADPRSQASTEIHQNIGQAKKASQSSVPSLAEAEAKQYQFIEAMRSTSVPSNQQPSSDRPGAIHQLPVQIPSISDAGQGGNLYGEVYQDGQEQRVMASSNAHGTELYHAQESRQDIAEPTFFTSPLPPIPKLPPPPQDFLPAVSSLRPGSSHIHMDLQEPYSEAETGVDSSYGLANSDYDEHLSHEVPNREPFHPHGDGASYSALPPHHVPKIPPNETVDYNHQHLPRVPLQHPPSMPHHRIGSPPPVRGYHEDRSSPQPISDDPYFDPYHDHPPRSPSPPHYDMHPVSPHAHEYYPEEIPPHYPEHKVRLHLEHRLPPPHFVRAPHPGHYPPPRPLRRPPPVPYEHEPPFPRGKRPGPPFGGPPRGAGPFYPPKRPYLPPHY
ncbi:regulation of nuclear pre-mRNA domain-containing protein 2a isoform X2 [Myxocyprinus asiaticus]|uniref:regulation of nuclear pre-mRNA domain-containing protein 2a isoform X2 n=1 Tax=Myxocyprinus asiaticus TaxID=70543 RepID=UPI0022229064|nr:regulation of nuclear pre-mRNA domain-containing protein 2a isoform X2 [Myxocyprinus asiaticus]